MKNCEEQWHTVIYFAFQIDVYLSKSLSDNLFLLQVIVYNFCIKVQHLLDITYIFEFHIFLTLLTWLLRYVLSTTWCTLVTSYKAKLKAVSLTQIPYIIYLYVSVTGLTEKVISQIKLCNVVEVEYYNQSKANVQINVKINQFSL